VTTLAPPTRVLVVDDDPRMRRLTCLTIELADGPFTIAGEAGCGNDALAQWRALQPDLVVLDYAMPGCNGLVLAAEILAERPEQRIVLFSAALDPELEVLARHVGVTASVPKLDVSELPDVLLRCRPA
jgi:DNA-binding NarL/FixJ family response regulator